MLRRITYTGKLHIEDHTESLERLRTFLGLA